jgi:hypothetical protein
MGEIMKTVLLTIAALAFLSFPRPGSATGPGDESAQTGMAVNSEASEELLITLEAPLMSPLFSRTPVAVVDEEPITFRDLTKRISSIHAGRAEQATSTKKDYASLLERVITTRLIVEEARNIGFDELSEIEDQIDQFSTKMLLSSLMRPQLESVEPDPAEVEALYKQMSREALLAALKFKREEDALAFQEEYESSGDFDQLARRFIESGRAEGKIDGQQYMKFKDLLPRIAEATFEMDPGSLSSIFTTPEGLLLFYLYDFRPYEDTALKVEARQALLEPLQREKAGQYIDLLIDEYSTIDRRLLEGVDFEKQTTGVLWAREEQPVDFQVLLADERVLATVHGDEPFTVTVGDVAAEVEKRHFHGVEHSAEKKKLNQEKWPVLRDILFKTIGRMVAIDQGKDQTEEYVDALGEFTSALLFDTFVKKVVAPDVEISEEEARDYYAAHLDEFSSPTMFRMDGLVFHDMSDAKSALKKLRRGADLKWVSANSPGQIDKEKEKTFVFDNALLSLTALPEELQKAAEGARQGDSLFYSSPDDFHHVITIEKVFPAEPKPYGSVRQSIARIIFEEKVEALIEDWSGKLREVYETRIFVTELDE